MEVEVAARVVVEVEVAAEKGVEVEIEVDVGVEIVAEITRKCSIIGKFPVEWLSQTKGYKSQQSHRRIDWEACQTASGHGS